MKREGQHTGDVTHTESSPDQGKKRGWAEEPTHGQVLKRLSIGSGDEQPTQVEVNIQSPLCNLCKRTLRKPKKTSINGTSRKLQKGGKAGLATHTGTVTFEGPTLRDEEQAESEFLMIGMAGMHPSPLSP